MSLSFMFPTTSADEYINNGPFTNLKKKVSRSLTCRCQLM